MPNCPIATEAFIALCRREVVKARVKTVSDSMTPAQERELWQIVDCREWFIKILAVSYQSELEQIDRELVQNFRLGPSIMHQ